MMLRIWINKPKALKRPMMGKATTGWRAVRAGSAHVLQPTLMIQMHSVVSCRGGPAAWRQTRMGGHPPQRTTSATP